MPAFLAIDDGIEAKLFEAADPLDAQLYCYEKDWEYLAHVVSVDSTDDISEYDKIDILYTINHDEREEH